MRPATLPPPEPTLPRRPRAQRAEDTAFPFGPRTLPTRYFLAPLAGYTHLAFRTAVRELGGLGLATTDLVLAKHLLAGSRKAGELLRTDDGDRPLSVQIFGSDPHDLAEAARRLEAHGCGGVDLNMGCPMAKVTGSGGGARLACDAGGAVRLVETVVAATRLPVTVKMRLGWDRGDLTAPALSRAFERVGVTAVTVHGRTRSQGFGGAVDRAGIAAVADAVEAIPVVGNGDVHTPEDALAMRAETGCDAVAIGRGAMLDPWIFRKLADRAAGRPPRDPTADERLGFLDRHFTLMCRDRGEYACTLFRKFAAWYGATLGVPPDLEDRLRRFESTAEFAAIFAAIRERQGECGPRVPTALVKVPNGPVERW